MRQFAINNEWYGEPLLYQKKRITIQEGLTVLVGCNGSGKTTLLHQIKKSLEKKNIKCLHYDNLTDGGANSRSAHAFHNDFAFLATSMQSSEGEEIMLNIGTMAHKMGKYATDRGEEEQWILLDACDSGLSIDNIVILKDLFNLAIEHAKGPIHIIISANEYELARGEECFDVVGCQYVNFSDYEEYRDYILSTKKAKNGE